MAGLGAAAGFGTVGRIQLDLNAQPGTVGNYLEIYKRKIRARVLWVLTSWSSYSVKVANRIPLDGSPGGAYDLNEIESGKILIEDFYGPGDHLYYSLPELVETWEPAVQLHLSKFSFVPTASALNLPSLFPTPFVPIDPVGVVANSLTTFHKVHILDPTLYSSTQTAPTNESHLAYTPSSIEPFEAIISPGVLTNLTIINTNGQVVNYGANISGNSIISTSKVIKNLITIGNSQNSTLCINCSGYLGNSLTPTNLFSNSEEFSVRLSQTCAGTPGRIRVQSNGSLLIGETGAYIGTLIVGNGSWIELNGGIIEVREGSKLIIESGGELRLNGGQVRVYDGGEIIVKAGGLLIYEDGVTLVLNGNNAQLALGGHTHIGDNATFRFFWQGSESGYIRLLKEGHWLQRFSAGTNARTRLQGTGMDDLILYMEQDVDWSEYGSGEQVPDHNLTSNAFERVTFGHGKIVMEGNSRIGINKDGRFTNVRIEPFNHLATRGVLAFTRLEFEGCDLFKTRVEGAFQYGLPSILLVTNSKFDRSPVNVTGRGFRIYNSHFIESQIYGLHNSLYCEVSSTNFEVRGVRHSGNGELRVTGCNFLNGGIGVSKEYGHAMLRCNTFRNMGYGVDAGKDATINMSTLSGAGYNYFEDNVYNFELFYPLALDVSRGYNELYAGSSGNILGVFSIPNASFCSNVMDLSSNIWTPGIANPPYPDLSNFSVYYDYGSGSIQICPANLEFEPTATPVRCGEFDRPVVDEPITPPGGELGPKSNIAKSAGPGLPLVNVPGYFEVIPLDVAMQLSASMMSFVDSSEANDATAAAMFYELLSATLSPAANDSLQAEVEKLRWTALKLYKSTIEQMLTDSTLSIEANQNSFDHTVAAYVHTLMNFTDSVKTFETYLRQFNLELMKAAIFHTIGKPEHSYAILSHLSECDHDSIRTSILHNQMAAYAFEIVSTAQGINWDDSTSMVSADSTAAFNYLLSTPDSSSFGAYIVHPNMVWYTSCQDWHGYKSNHQSKQPEALVQFFPNPATDVLNLRITASQPLDEALMEFKLYDLQGRVLLSKPVNGARNTIALPKLPGGIYLGSVYQNGVSIHNERVVVMQ